MLYCHFCGSQTVRSYSSMEAYKYKQQTCHALTEYSVCEQCGEEFITTEQITRNEVCIPSANENSAS
jgi:YgiT-type zinc finger domain-containing protein